MTPLVRNGLRALLALLVLTAVACDPSDPCDPGYYEAHGVCYPNEEEPDPESDAGDGDQDGGSEGGDAEPPSDPYESFGEACTDDGDCENDAICGGEMLPYCTQVNCMDDPSICPPDWTCFDVTGLSPDPNVTSICLQ